MYVADKVSDWEGVGGGGLLNCCVLHSGLVGSAVSSLAAGLSVVFSMLSRSLATYSRRKGQPAPSHGRR